MDFNQLWLELIDSNTACFLWHIAGLFFFFLVIFPVSLLIIAILFFKGVRDLS